MINYTNEKSDYSITAEKHVVVCLPYYRCQAYIHKAVETLLAQTYRNITVVVLNDADIITPPWAELSDITDPRLVRFDLKQNRGPYFATQLLLSATDAPYLLIQDADDWSHPQRIQKLVEALDRDNADFAISAQSLIQEHPDNTGEVINVRWLEESNGRPRFNDRNRKFKLSTKLTRRFVYRSAHHGLFRTKVLRDIGGYYGGFRTSYDTILTNFIMMVGKISHIPEPLYYRLVRPASLTQSFETGHKSPQRKQTLKKLDKIYGNTYQLYKSYLKGHITGNNLIKSIRAISEMYISEEDREAISLESKMLRQHLLV